MNTIDELIPRIDQASYSVYFGMGYCIKLLDDPRVFRVSLAGIAFGSLLVRYLTKDYAFSKFLDLGTGSGVHAFLLRNMGMKCVAGTDISREAINAARENELYNFGSNVIEFEFGDLFNALPAASEKYDVILFNPPGWRTPSASFLEALKQTSGEEQLSIDSMFYGDRTIVRFFEKLPNYLVDGGKVIIGLNSLVGIQEVLRKFSDLHEHDYSINYKLLERHDFPLLLYTENWKRVEKLLIGELMSWTRRGESYCSIQHDGKIVWSYEIIELTLSKR